MWKVGQEVWDVCLGKGVIVDYVPNGRELPVTARFFVDKGETYTREYTEDGRWKKSWNRTLFFSKPKVEGATEPPFEPTLKKGDKVCIHRTGQFGALSACIAHVHLETETCVIIQHNGLVSYRKDQYTAYKLGEPLY